MNLSALVRVLRHPSTAEQVATIGNEFARSVRVAMGPEVLRDAARQSYIDGRCTLEEMEARLDRIDREFPS